jgi:hypothetical protein
MTMRSAAFLSAAMVALLAPGAWAQQPVAPAAPAEQGAPTAPAGTPEQAGAKPSHDEMMMRGGRGFRGRGPEVKVQTDDLSVSVQCSFRETTDQCAEAALKLLDRLTTDDSSKDDGSE